MSSDGTCYLPPSALRWRWAGRLPIEVAVAANLRLAQRARHDGVARLLAFEPAAAVLTLGRRALAAGLSEENQHNQEICRDRQIPLLAADRGGLATLHLPGQAVLFLALPWRDRDVRPLVRSLLQAVVDVAAARGLHCSVRDDHDAGVWLADGKLASIGLRIADGVVVHGLALNAAIDPRLADGLVLCGHRDARYASLAAVASVGAVAKELVEAWQRGCEQSAAV